MTTTLVADIGGSKSRFGLANSSGRLEHILVIENDTVADLDAAVARYLEETGARPCAATLAVAGSVGGEEVVLTNRTNWRLRHGEFGKRFGFSQLRVLNDFEAVAWALPHLGAAHTRPLGTPVEPREGVKVVLGPGTGLGVAALLPADGRWHVIASEGGHASFGPQALDETAMFAKLREECGAISAETVLSGPGLVRLARALDPQAGRHEPETIVASALAREPSAHAAARMFVRLLGRFAGGLALTFKALGGVYITGGVAGGLGPLLDEPQFRTAFEAHPPHEGLLKTIPTLLITCPQPGLIGCAALASEHAVTV
ncbi:MAG TPA: ROK family protein [Xanthobacteraceae bacterium]|jgi:glucokinase|nr:ROK family protein [Xanthobacteraceae bacterium]